MKELIYSITIGKPPEVVFEKLTDKSVFPAWAKAWGEGMTFEGEWREGSHVSFFDDTQGGTKVIVEELIPDQLIKLKHVAMVNPQNIEVELADEMMRKWIGSREDYFFTRNGEQETTVKVVMTTDEIFEEMMNPWHKALQYFKEICEA